MSKAKLTKFNVNLTCIILFVKKNEIKLDYIRWDTI